MPDFIEPRILKGFRDFLPPAEIARRNLVEKIEASFRSYGFVPIDTPALEYSDILLGKGGGETEKQIYRFRDNGDRDVALRFDLTVPFARFLAEHRANITFPFKRYHIAKVWRGENTQRGRYREFTQCDFDTVGSDSAAVDFEILHMMQKNLPEICGGDVIIRFNHRGLFNRYLSRLGVLDSSADILRTVDKLAKIGRDETLCLLSEFVGNDKAAEIIGYVGLSGTFEETFGAMTSAAGSGPESEQLDLIWRYMNDAGIAGSFILDPSITRGLDYYTGVVFESFMTEMIDIGSICSGGHYDNLVGLYTKNKNNQENLSGVGASIGIDRLIAALEALGRLGTEQSYARTAIACMDKASGGKYQALADILRKVGIPCEVFLDEEKITKQFQRAEKKGLTWLIIPGSEDSTHGALTLRDLAKRESREGLKIEEIVSILKKQ